MAAMPTGTEHRPAAEGLIPLELLGRYVAPNPRPGNTKMRLAWVASVVMLAIAAALTVRSPARPTTAEKPREIETVVRAPKRSSRAPKPSRRREPRPRVDRARARDRKATPVRSSELPVPD